ncbi:MAG: hypothetical protein QOG64_2238 [Acidimicrobiaceae bacterium]|nr:hypothetical protein [Acidimicrobiaceae bacterium]
MWQELRRELHPQGVEIVTVALDTGGADAARPWIEAAQPEHPSLIDEAHVTDELFGFVNVPNAVWIDEDGMIVRPAHGAHVKKSPLREMEVPEGLGRIGEMLTEVKKIRTDPDLYLEAVRDWAANGGASRFALAPDQVVERSRPRPPEHAEAAAAFELGQHLWRQGDRDAAVPWFRRAHALQPDNWTYKRQAWTLATTVPGEPSDLIQGPTDLYEGNWLDDVRGIGAENYYEPFEV